MKISLKQGVIAAAVGLSMAFLAGAVQAQDAANVIKYRQGVMKANAAHLGNIFAIVKGEAGSSADIAGHAAALAAQAQMQDGLWPKGSGAESGAKTRALPAIWQDSAKFQQVISQIKADTAMLVEAAAGGDMAAIGAAAGAVRQERRRRLPHRLPRQGELTEAIRPL